MKKFLRHRAWDKNLKRMGWVYNIDFENTPPEMRKIMVVYDAFDKNGWAQMSYQLITGVNNEEKYNTFNDVALMFETGIEDDTKKSIFEDDIVEFVFQHPATMLLTKLRGRVIWNPNLSYGDYGFVVIDEEGGFHPFHAMDSMKVVGNIFQGVVTT